MYSMPEITHRRCNSEYPQRVWGLILPKRLTWYQIPFKMSMSGLVLKIRRTWHSYGPARSENMMQPLSVSLIWTYPRRHLSTSFTAKMLEWCLSWFQTTEEQHFFDPLISMVQNLAQSRNHFQEQVVCGNPAVKAKIFKNMERCCSVPDDLDAREYLFY